MGPLSSNFQLSPRGFTLAELLIALSILGIIATFTIPKILISQTDGKQAAIAKEAAATISGAYQKAQFEGLVSSATDATDLTPYLNYVSLDTSSTLVDGHPGGAAEACSASKPCLSLHNGAVLQLYDYSFAGTSTTNFIEFRLDPHGSSNGTADSVQFALYYNGRITTRGDILTGSGNSNAVGLVPCACDPAWFSW